jgi:hypothetical protein
MKKVPGHRQTIQQYLSGKLQKGKFVETCAFYLETPPFNVGLCVRSARTALLFNVALTVDAPLKLNPTSLMLDRVHARFGLRGIARDQDPWAGLIRTGGPINDGRQEQIKGSSRAEFE